jgi:protein SCO1
MYLASTVALLLVTAAVVWTSSWNAVSRLPVLPPAGAVVVSGHRVSGPVLPPRRMPAMTVVLDNGETVELKSLFAGHWTLAQLIFTGCSTTCPIQGAVFSKTQAELKAANVDAQLLSISIDPLGDDAKSLTNWLDSFDRGPGWRAVIPPYDNLGPLLDILGGRGKGIDVHDARAYLVDPKGDLRFITEELPSTQLLVNLVKKAQAATAITTP